MRLGIFALLILISSCVNDYKFKRVEPYYIFHDNSSKVWVENHIYENGKERSPLSLAYKKMLVFHNSGNCYEYTVQNLGQRKGKKGIFNLDIDKKMMEIQFENESWKFKIATLTEAKIVLIPLKKTKNNYKIELISFPEY